MIVSYAQNFEDVRLWRALGHVERGCYVDIGAQDPIVDSVSRAFYEKGWRGVHVEPSSSYAARLAEDRPDERVIAALVTNTPGLLTFYEFPGTGLSTADREIAKRHEAAGHRMQEVTVPTVSLAAILDSLGGRDVHWLKIDVEGFEHAVLRSWGRSRARPWVLVVESTAPTTQEPTHKRWEPLVLRRGYHFVCFDGLNRYYVAATHRGLAGSLAAAPNVFDGFSLSGTASSSYAALLNNRTREALESAAAAASEASKAKEEALLVASEASKAKEALLAVNEASKAREEALLASNEASKAREDALSAQCESLRQAQIAEREKYLDETASLARQLEKRERELSDQSLAFERARVDLAEKQAARERQFAEQVAAGERDMAGRQAAFQHEIQEMGRALAERERAHAERLSNLHREQVRVQDAMHAQAKAFAEQVAIERRAEREGMARAAQELETRLSNQLHRVQAELTTLVSVGARREERYVAQLRDSRAAARETEEALKAGIEGLRRLAMHQSILLRLAFASRSWQVTAPLRAMAQFIRRVLGRGVLDPLEQAQPSAEVIEQMANARGGPVPSQPPPPHGIVSSIASAMAIRGGRLDATGHSPDSPAR